MNGNWPSTSVPSFGLCRVSSSESEGEGRKRRKRCSGSAQAEGEEEGGSQDEEGSSGGSEDEESSEDEAGSDAESDASLESGERFSAAQWLSEFFVVGLFDCARMKLLEALLVLGGPCMHPKLVGLHSRPAVPLKAIDSKNRYLRCTATVAEGCPPSHPHITLHHTRALYPHREPGGRDRGC